MTEGQTHYQRKCTIAIDLLFKGYTVEIEKRVSKYYKYTTLDQQFKQARE